MYFIVGLFFECDDSDAVGLKNDIFLSPGLIRIHLYLFCAA